MVIFDAFNNSVLTPEYLKRMQSSLSACFVPAAASLSTRSAIEKIMALRATLKEHAEHVVLADSAADLERAQAAGRVALLLTVEDGLPVEFDLNLLSVFRNLGIVRFQLVATTQNQFGCGKDERYDGSLSKLGIEFVGRAEAAGIMLDLSHLSHNSFRDAIAAASRPVFVSHCNVQGCYEHQQNLTDEELDMVGENGGIVGITGLPYLLRNRSFDDVLDNIEYVARRIGTKHVAFGSALMQGHPDSFYAGLPGRLSLADYGPFPWVWPPGYDSPESFATLPERLSERGMSTTEIADVMGNNLLRVTMEFLGERMPTR